MALSGGGFRAAFFHVGVLARLAELDLLRQVRTLSCVSGGSIAGAIYYLTVLSALAGEDTVVDEHLIRKVGPEPLTKEQLAACVRRTYGHLQQAARVNIRALVFKNPAKNLLMFLSTAYSRTDRAGDMLDRHLYRRILQTELRLWQSHKQLELRHLGIEHPSVPRLVLNATTLNSGHSWRFGTDGMGENPVGERGHLDRNDLFEFTTYANLPAHQANFPLALAVAASACFPILFRPLPISDLYDDTRVDLMDGGAQDNQGIQALLEEHECKAFETVIVSDGAGQLEDERIKRRLVVSVIPRVIGVQGDRIREEQLLAAEHRLGKEKLKLVDLRHGIARRVLRVVGESDKPRPPDVRESLASIRTDLDSFADLESALLVARGFRVAAVLGGGESDPCPLLRPADRAELEAPSRLTFRILERARRQLWKPWLYWLAVAAAGVPAVGYALYGVYRAGPGGRDEVRMWLVLLAFLLLPAMLSRFLFRWVPWHHGWIRWAAVGAIYAGLLAGARLAGPALDGFVGMSWSSGEATLLGVLLLALPAFAPCLLWLLLSPEGRIWRKFAH